jgi:colanic acid biosynthesis protein WcaH
MMIPDALYKEIMRAVPILCVDAIVRRADGRFLLVRRTNDPLKGEWWVIGGRVLHGEKADDAVLRKLRTEAGLTPTSPPVFAGVYQDFFERNSIEDHPYHTVSLVFEVVVQDCDIALDDQSDDHIWADALPARFVVQQTHS